jgi:hypothetical protein
LRSEDESEFGHADQAAKAIGIDTWDVHWLRLIKKPTDSGRWYHVMTRCTEDRIDKVLEFAEANLDLAAIATGAADELGFGPKFAQHSCLDFVLQDIRRFPGRGAKLIEAGLQSPVTRNRNMAVTALGAWPRKEWSSRLETALKRAEKCEPDAGARERMEKVLQGEPLSP